MIRRLLYAASLAILALALVFVPLPVLIIAPGLAASVTGQGSAPALIDVAGQTDELQGRYLLTAVQVSSKSTVQTVDALLDDVEEVTFGGTVVPPGVEPGEFVEFQRQLFRESIRTAAAAGARAAGRQVTVTGDGARVVEVVPNAPAAGELQTGDVIVAVDGERVELASELVNLLEGRQLGETVELRVRRGDRTINVQADLGRISAAGGPGLGVLIETLNLRVELPVEVTPGENVRIGGPSGGLMFALTVFDLLDDGDLAGGRTIAGTGTINLNGEVGRISGIQAKVVAAEQAGATLFLAPQKQAEAARKVAGPELEVVGVSTLDEAIAALRQASPA